MVTEEEFNLIEKRFESLNEHFKFVSFGTIPSLSKDEILEHLKARDEIGKEIAEHQLYYLKKLRER